MLGIIKKFGKILNKKQKSRVAILFVMMLIGAVLEVFGVSLMLPLMTALTDADIIHNNEIASFVCGIFGITDHRSFVMLCIISLIVIFVVKDLFLMLEYYAQARFVSNNRFHTQQVLLEVILNRPYEFFLSASSGELVRVIHEDTRTTFDLLSTLMFFATESILSVALMITVFVIDPLMTAFVALAMTICLLIIAKLVRPTMRKEGLIRQKHYALVNKWILQSISGIKEIKVTHRERFFQDNFEYSGQKLANADRKNTVFNNIPRLAIEMITICSMLVVMGILILNGRPVESLLPSLGAFAMAAVKLLPSANRITSAFNSIAYQGPALDKMIENLDNLGADGGEAFVQDKPTKKIGNNESRINLNNSIKLSDIVFSYPNSDSEVLHHADMEIPIGKSVGVVGASGAGKTTAIDIMLGLLAPKEGQVLADNVDVMTDYAGWLSHIGYIPQSIFMLDDTIRANVAFGVDKDNISDAQVQHALEEAQLWDFIKTLPDGLDTSIGERGIRLSGGQRQRIGIARALYTDPEVLVFDEATSSLDNETEAAIMESINSLHGKKTLVIIAHRLQTIEKCDIVYRVENGKILLER